MRFSPHRVACLLLLAAAALAAGGCDRDRDRPAARFVREIEWIGQGEWVKADTHLHTRFSDGKHSVSEVAYQGRKFGCDCIAITDHADADRKAASAEYADEIRIARRQFPDLIVLAGLEWNVPPWGGDEHVTVIVPPGSDEFGVLAGFKHRFDDFGREEPVGRAVEALRWLEESSATAAVPPVVFYNHPGRSVEGPERLAAGLEAWSRAGDLAIGFSGAPGHQRGIPLGAYRSPSRLIDRWDRAAAEVGGTWDRLLQKGLDVWAARAPSDFHSENGVEVSDYWPGEFSETWLYVPERTPAGVLQAFHAGSFFAAHGHIARRVELTLEARGLNRPAHAGEVVEIAAGTPISLALSCQVPDSDWSGRPNRIDSIELIGVTQDRAEVIAAGSLEAPDSASRHQFVVPAGGMAVRARGRRVIEDGPDLMFYTNPIRVLVPEPPVIEPDSQSPALTRLLSMLSMRQAAGSLLLLLVVAAVCVQALRGRRGGNSQSAAGDGRAPHASEAAARPASGAKPSLPRAVNPPRRGHLLAAAVFFTAIAVYGSLVPLRYGVTSLEDAVARFREIPFLTMSLENRADWVANILLFIPLGFFWCGGFALDRRSSIVRIAWTVPVVIACGVLACGLEFTQIWFPPRTVSQNDIIAETLGGLIGVGSWLLVGQEFANWFRRYTARAPAKTQIDWLLQAYLLGLVIYAVMPLDLTIQPSELYHKWQNGRIELLPHWPSNSSGAELWGYATDALIFVPVGALVWRAWAGGHRGARMLVESVFLGGCLVVGVELAQLLVYSRFTSATDVLTGTLGVFAGASVARQWQPSRPDLAACDERRRLLGGLPWLLAAVVYAAALCAIFWWPYLVEQDAGAIRARANGFLHVPFARLYTGSEYNAMTEIVRKLLLLIPLGFLLTKFVLCFRLPRTLRRAGLALAVVLVGVFGTCMELGQALFPPHFPDVTDVLLYVGGASLGLLIAVRLDRATYEVPGKSSVEARAGI